MFVVTRSSTGSFHIAKKYYDVNIIKSGLTFRSSFPEEFYKKGVLKSFSKFTRKHLFQSLRPATLLKEPLEQVLTLIFTMF